MKNVHFRTISFPHKRKQSMKIRSPAFKRKYDDGMPRINKKAIEFHNIYDVEIPEKVPDKQKGLDFWGCIPPQKKRIVYKNIKPATSPERETLTRGENMFRNYIKRRPDLRLTSTSFSRPESPKTLGAQTSENKRNKSSQNTFRNLERQHFETTKPEKIDQELEQKLQNGFLITQEEIAKINNKSIHQMTIQELKVSIEWKKQFYAYYKQKLENLTKSRQNQTISYH